ncbi:MAG TPA: hypothetical protein VGO62_18295 [Myxococcota bacterium]|jgi:hypothetical protein
MRQAEIERRILQLWTTTQVPLTLANVQAYTGASRGDVGKALDAMSVAQTVEFDSDDDGNLIYKVLGSARIPRGATTIGEVMKLEGLRADVSSSASGGSHALVRSRGGDEKSMVASGLLSFFFGPFGLLYAAPVLDAVVPIGVLMALVSVVPHAILSPLLGILWPIFGVAGVVYAYRHNKHGKRMSMLESTTRKQKLLK